mmetsp:Transcript_45640/g.84667  ORF Transcript_45640/g.84667 Transcript_45640/m.84667 type:complete len:220 (-) Transcript_45640:504-1163(-)
MPELEQSTHFISISVDHKRMASSDIEMPASSSPNRSPFSSSRGGGMVASQQWRFMTCLSGNSMSLRSLTEARMSAKKLVCPMSTLTSTSFFMKRGEFSSSMSSRIWTAPPRGRRGDDALGPSSLKLTLFMSIRGLTLDGNRTDTGGSSVSRLRTLALEPLSSILVAKARQTTSGTLSLMRVKRAEGKLRVPAVPDWASVNGAMSIELSLSDPSSSVERS